MIELKHVSKVFETAGGRVEALKDISLTIPDGDVYGIIGMSGAGKSTLVRCINMLERPTSGEVIVNGKRLDTMSPAQLRAARRDITMIFQRFNLLMQRNCLDNVCFPMELAGVSRREAASRAQELLETVGLPDKAKAYPAQLSGGQQQRVAIARALVTGPAIICMDEPLSNLDAKLRVQLRNELKKMQKDFGITTIYVTHDQEEALTLSDRIAVFNKGFIEQIGTPNEVYNHSQTEFVCNFIGDINRLNDDTVSALRAAGAEVDASKHNYIRLERLHVNVAPRGGEIALDGTVESCEYYGLYIKYYIHVGTQSLKVIEKNDGVNIYDPGQRVKVILNPNDIMAYAPSAEEVE